MTDNTLGCGACSSLDSAQVVGGARDHLGRSLPSPLTQAPHPWASTQDKRTCASPYVARIDPPERVTEASFIIVKASNSPDAG